MIGILKVHLPEIFTTNVGNDRKPFQCSDAFIGCFIKHTLGWSKRKGTQAGQKLPVNAEEQMEAHLFRIAIAITDNDIPESCVANGDQTGNVYSQAALSTYDQTGTNQVMIIGKEDKRAFTIMVGISMSGDVLPFQIMYPGSTSTSRPSVNDPKCHCAIFQTFFSLVFSTLFDVNTHGHSYLSQVHLVILCFG